MQIDSWKQYYKNFELEVDLDSGEDKNDMSEENELCLIPGIGIA